MPGLLDGQLAKEIYAGFRGKLQRATLHRFVPTPSMGLDNLGDPVDPEPQTWPCQGFVEAYNDAFRARAGIPLTDSKVNIFAASLPAGVRPQKDDQVNIPAGGPVWWQLRRADTDPATALWTCQAFQCRTPSE